MMNRRRFLQFSAAAGLPVLARPLWPRTQSPAHFPIGLQLSTLVKQETQEGELKEYFRQIAAIGFQEVEPSHAVYSVPANQLRKDITESGLTIASGHFVYADLTADIQGKLDYAKALGLKYVVCSSSPKSLWTSAEGFQTAARAYNEWGKRARDMGMRFAMHNHDYEFRKFDGVTGYDILLKETDPNLVFLEMDCYWIAQAGLDPVQMLNQVGKRVRMLHIKDRKPGFPSSNDMNLSSAHFTEVGTGSIPWPAVLAAAEQLQIEHYFIEQDRIEGPPLESIRTSYNYLRKILP
jgi:sugar phosphate isomerase/epimerase